MRRNTILAVVLATLFHLAHGADGLEIDTSVIPMQVESPENSPSINLASLDPGALPAIPKGMARTHADTAPSRAGSLNSPARTLETGNALPGLLKNIRSEWPSLRDISVLPVIKKVYPTGAKPLVILSFKCPTEVFGVTPPPVKILHGIVDLGLMGINKSNILSFDLQQVCS